jgi:hypothetical protein
MSKKLVDGVWVTICDWVDENGSPCDLGAFGEPRMFVDPDGGKDPETHFQCGSHHGVVKQEDKPEFQLPEGHKLNDDALVQDEDADLDKKVGPRLDGFKPDLEKTLRLQDDER